MAQKRNLPSITSNVGTSAAKLISVCAGSDLRKLKVKIGDEVTATFKVKGNKVKETTGFVLEVSKKGHVKLHKCRRWMTVVRTLKSAEEHWDLKRRTSK